MNESAVWVGITDETRRRTAHLYEKFIFSNQICAAPYRIQDNFRSSIKVTELNKQQALMNSQLGLCRQESETFASSFLDPYLHVLVNASAHLYVCMYVHRGSPYSTWSESHLHSAPLPVANGIHLCQTAAW